jgi:hypothetical protein
MVPLKPKVLTPAAHVGRAEPAAPELATENNGVNPMGNAAGHCLTSTSTSLPVWPMPVAVPCSAPAFPRISGCRLFM